MSKEQEEIIANLSRMLVAAETRYENAHQAYGDVMEANLGFQNSLREANEKIEDKDADLSHLATIMTEYSDLRASVEKALKQLNQSPLIYPENWPHHQAREQAYGVCVRQAIKDLDPQSYFHQEVTGAMVDGSSPGTTIPMPKVKGDELSPKLTTFAELATFLGYDVDQLMRQYDDDDDDEPPYSLVTGPIHDAIAQMNLANGVLSYNSKVNLVGKDVVPNLKKRIKELESCLKSKTERELMEESVREAGHRNKVADLTHQLGKAQSELRRITRERDPDPDPLQAKLEDAHAAAVRAEGALGLELGRKHKREDIIKSQYEEIDIVKNMLNEKTARCHDLEKAMESRHKTEQNWRLEVEQLRDHKQMLIDVHQDLTLLAMDGKDSVHRRISRVAENIESGVYRKTKVDTPVLCIARLTGPFAPYPNPSVYKRCLLSSTQSPEAQLSALGEAMSAFPNTKHEIYDIAWQGLGRPGATVHTDRPRS
jgi:tetratricopeptide (TPR) repeat protein